MRRCRYAKTRAGVRVVALAVTLACVSPARAWGPLGHRVVARLAEAELTPQAWAEARKLLALRGARHLSDVAAWADDLRHVAPDLYQKTKRMHYVNFHSRDCNYDPPRDCRDGECVVAAIEKYSAMLADRTNSPAVRAEALAFLVHFVGDVHQPLHASLRHDAGGNDYQVRWHGRRTNLHRIWDSLLLDSEHLSARGYATRLMGEPASSATGGSPAQWAEESCRIDRDDGVYPDTHSIGQAYVDRERPIAERRLRQAGDRLAALLNRDLANG